MPCNDGGGPGSSRIEYVESPEMEKRRHKLARMLCGVLGNMSKSEIAQLSDETQIWWKIHQKEDNDRKIREAQLEAKKKLKAKALSKLTLSERKILGL